MRFSISSCSIDIGGGVGTHLSGEHLSSRLLPFSRMDSFIGDSGVHIREILIKIHYCVKMLNGLLITKSLPR